MITNGVEWIEEVKGEVSRYLHGFLMLKKKTPDASLAKFWRSPWPEDRGFGQKTRPSD